MLFIVLFMTSVMGVFAQSNKTEIVRKGNTFTQVVESNKPKATGFTYKDSKGNVYDIYLSSKGKAFVLKVSKKTDKEYRYYLPNEIAEQIINELKKK